MTVLLALVADPIPQPDPAWGFGLGGAVFVVSATALWAGVHLRGRTHARLRQQVDIAFAGLTEQAIAVLQELRSHLNSVLPDPDDPFDPLDVIMDPSTVEPPATRGIRVLKKRNRIRREFKILLTICSLLKYFAIAFTLLVLGSTSLYFFLYSLTAVWQSFCWLTAGVAGMAGVLVTAYGVFETRIQASIEDSNPIDELVGVAPR